MSRRPASPANAASGDSSSSDCFLWRPVRMGTRRHPPGLMPSDLPRARTPPDARGPPREPCDVQHPGAGDAIPSFQPPPVPDASSSPARCGPAAMPPAVLPSLPSSAVDWALPLDLDSNFAPCFAGSGVSPIGGDTDRFNHVWTPHQEEIALLSPPQTLLPVIPSPPLTWDLVCWPNSASPILPEALEVWSPSWPPPSPVPTPATLGLQPQSPLSSNTSPLRSDPDTASPEQSPRAAQSDQPSPTHAPAPARTATAPSTATCAVASYADAVRANLSGSTSSSGSATDPRGPRRHSAGTPPPHVPTPVTRAAGLRPIRTCRQQAIPVALLSERCSSDSPSPIWSGSDDSASSPSYVPDPLPPRTRPRREPRIPPPSDEFQGLALIEFPIPKNRPACPCCSTYKGLTTTTSLRQHIRQVHKKKVGFRCAHCAKPFLALAGCKVHQSRCPALPRGTPASSPLEQGPSPDRLATTSPPPTTPATPSQEPVIPQDPNSHGSSSSRSSAVSGRPPRPSRIPTLLQPHQRTAASVSLANLSQTVREYVRGVRLNVAERRTSAPPRLQPYCPPSRDNNTRCRPGQREGPSQARGGDSTSSRPPAAPSSRHNAPRSGTSRPPPVPDHRPAARRDDPRPALDAPEQRRTTVHAPLTPAAPSSRHGAPRSSAGLAADTALPPPAPDHRPTARRDDPRSALDAPEQRRATAHASPTPDPGEHRAPAASPAVPETAQPDSQRVRGNRERTATAWQLLWLEELTDANSFRDLEDVVKRLTEELAEGLVPQEQAPTRTQHPRRGPPAPRPNPEPAINNRRDDTIAATRLQRLYRSNRPKAMREILEEPSPFCDVPADHLHAYFSNVFDHAACPETHRPDCLPRLPRVDSADDLERDFTPKEVFARLARTSNTAPGKDGIRYQVFKKRDPGCLVLAAIFNLCKQFRRIPSAWKSSMTVLLYKKGDRQDPGNWRPISLSSTIYKLYTSCLAARLTDWAVSGGAISAAQKGFMSCEGCYEHNYVLQAAIQSARRQQKQCAMAWLDLSNAFGSIPHHLIFDTLREFGLPDFFLHLLRDLYSDCTTTIRAEEGETAPILLRRGVKQGCPLSPIVFNLAMEPLLRAMANSPAGFNLYGEKISALAYADDLVLLADNPEGLRVLLEVASRAAEWMGLRFNARKCASLHISGNAGAPVHPTQFEIQGEPMTTLADGESYLHLGTPTGIRVQQTPTATIDGILEDAKKIDGSLLAPWQKINALNTFLIPRIPFALRGSAVAKGPLNKADRAIRQLARKWLYLPQRASSDIIYIPHRQGGANVPRMGDLCDIATVTHAFRLLTCPDHRVRSIASAALEETIGKRAARAPAPQDIVAFLNGSLENNLGRQGGELSSLWSRARAATRRLGKRIGCRWTWAEERGEMGILIPRGNSDQNTVVTPPARKMLERVLKSTLRCLYAENLKKKPDQGKVFEVSSKWTASNHFLSGGSFTRFADWRFVHRARLNCVPLNGAVRFGNRDKRCRRCGYENETLPHVLCGCETHSEAWRLRHNAIQARVVKALPPTLGTVAEDSTVPGTNSLLRPDIVITNEEAKKIVMVDVSVPFENRSAAFRAARLRKIAKYTPLADTLRARGYTVEIYALLVGALGSWDPQNEPVLEACGIGRRYAGLMRRLMVSDTIRWSRDIYTEHVTGHRQYHIAQEH
ncbi:uncharacterized protein LOC142824999 [Pelodiscus sinensis]|uniref:uncharacterized protein LOC142824999 n=1 Tax=Pelodiscus sinensis TaxID=13735 RepID=UPI003F6C96A1